MKPGRLILLLWFVAIALITRRAVVEQKSMPPPHAYVGSAMVYGTAALLGEFAPQLAATFAVGWTLALAYATVGGPEGPPENESKGG